MFDPALSEDTHLLGILARLRINEAQRLGRLTADQAKEAKVSLRALAAAPATAYERLLRYIIELAGEPWIEATQVAASLDLRLSRRLVINAEPLAGSLTPVFGYEIPLQESYTARLTLETGMRQKLLVLPELVVGALVEQPFLVPVAGLSTGRYRVQYELFDDAGGQVVQGMRDFFVDRGLEPTLERLRDARDRLAQIERPWTPSQQAALEAVCYIANTADGFTREYVASFDRKVHPMVQQTRKLDLTHYSGEPVDFHKDLPFAIELAEALREGGDPLPARRGDWRLAHRSHVDGTLQPFRVYVPAAYDGTKAWPLLLVLHGATGSESTYLDRYLDRTTGKSLLKKLADEHGYIVATPNGRGPFGGYVGASEADVLEVRQRVMSLYRIHERAVFLTGHSMGGAGTWHLGFRHPDKFQALAPVAGGPPNPDETMKAPGLPVLWCLGGKDSLISPAMARPTLEKIRGHLTALQWREYPQDDHFSVGVSSLPEIMEFFDRHRPLG